MIWYKLKEFVWNVLFWQGSSLQTMGTRRQSITQSNRQTVPHSVSQLVKQTDSPSVSPSDSESASQWVSSWKNLKGQVRCINKRDRLQIMVVDGNIWNVLTAHQKVAQNVCNSTIAFGPLNPIYSQYWQFSLSLGKTLTFYLNSTIEYGH